MLLCLKPLHFTSYNYVCVLVLTFASSMSCGLAPAWCWSIVFLNRAWPLIVRTPWVEHSMQCAYAMQNLFVAVRACHPQSLSRCSFIDQQLLLAVIRISVWKLAVAIWGQAPRLVSNHALHQPSTALGREPFLLSERTTSPIQSFAGRVSRGVRGTQTPPQFLGAIVTAETCSQ